MKRCAWATSEVTIPYHDEEWGVPVWDDRRLFELLVLEAAQAGLSWETILKKREGYRAAFARFDPAAVARFDSRRKARLLKDPGIVRNRLKIEAAIQNARAFLEVRKEFGGFAKYAWRFVGGKPKVNRLRSLGDIPSRSRESDALSEDLRRRGFKFVGTTICYAFMEAVGMVNDHTIGCFRRGVSSVRKPAAPRPGGSTDELGSRRERAEARSPRSSERRLSLPASRRRRA